MHDKEPFMDFDFDRLKETSWSLITVAVLVDVVVLLIAMQVVLPLLKSSFPVERLTNGLVQATLIFSIVRFALVVVCVIVLVGGLRARDVGLQWQKLPSGALETNDAPLGRAEGRLCSSARTPKLAQSVAEYSEYISVRRLRDAFANMNQWGRSAPAR